MRRTNKRFYVEFAQDYGYGAMGCHCIINSNKGWWYTRKNWISFRNYGGAYGIEALFELPKFMSSYSDEEVLEHYKRFEFKNQWVSPEDDKIFSKSIIRKILLRIFWNNRD